MVSYPSQTRTALAKSYTSRCLVILVHTDHLFTPQVPCIPTRPFPSLELVTDSGEYGRGQSCRTQYDLNSILEHRQS